MKLRYNIEDRAVPKLQTWRARDLGKTLGRKWRKPTTIHSKVSEFTYSRYIWKTEFTVVISQCSLNI